LLSIAAFIHEVVYQLLLLLIVQDLVELAHDAADSTASSAALLLIDVRLEVFLRALIHALPPLIQVSGWRCALEHQIKRLRAVEETLLGLLVAWYVADLIVDIVAAICKVLLVAQLVQIQGLRYREGGVAFVHLDHVVG